jgi:hypothetical protein
MPLESTDAQDGQMVGIGRRALPGAAQQSSGEQLEHRFGESKLI